MNEVGKVDGRELRWRAHNTARRLALLDGTISAVRIHGRATGLSEIASANGVSTSVLYKYFSSKDQLFKTAVRHYFETALIPQMHAATSTEPDDYRCARAMITTYVDAVECDRQFYEFVLTNNDGNRDLVAESEQLIAELLGTVIEERLRALGMDTGGAAPLAFGIVGAVRMTVHWWVIERSISKDSLVEYLAIMLWGGISGIAESEGSPSKFESRPTPAS
ncbi:TetR/AcrR family transcriptional regulator [Rhodococcus sp. 14-2483-1-2]|uniref:TetR/AcrR family transcriptional regulator n=1 Tax=Rhodococcus sp. 14-2483-1-2 TaxID=2023147 RepID=UPI000B9BD2D0|nr:TetR/AcrR family transcriptional regulator [Rhodococcus sp. 14-2483-1-2]OZF26105.1 hypothetical protein CH295_26115 [Rhodococcus sp. 14-2483-1-2]